MEAFRARLQEESAKVAAAAMQLSALDDMAQNDDYVHTEGLKLSAKREECEGEGGNNSELPSVVEDLSGRFVDALDNSRFVDALTTAARQHTRTPPRHTVNEEDKVQQRVTIKDTNKLSYAMENKPKRVGFEDDNKLSYSMNTSKPKATKDKPQPKLISSVAALYEQNAKEKNGIHHNKQSAIQSIHTKPHQHKDENRADISSKSKPNNVKLNATGTNVLLVNNHAHILHELDYESEESSDDDIDSDNGGNPPSTPQTNDIEMGTLGLVNQLENEIEESMIRQSSITNPLELVNENQKDVNRFMTMTTNLESERERLLQSYETGATSNPSNDNNNGDGKQNINRGGIDIHEEANIALKKGLSWVQNIASPQLQTGMQTISKQLRNKVSPDGTENKNGQSSSSMRGPMIGPIFTPTTREMSEDKITMSTSAALFADEDISELEAIRMRNLSSPLQVLLQTIQKDKRLALIVVTLVFAILSYFYSRHRSSDDVL